LSLQILLFLSICFPRSTRKMQSFFYERPTYVKVIWKEKIGVYFKYTKPYACGFTFEPSWDQRRTLKNLPPLSSKKTQLTTKNSIVHRHHGPPISPNSRGLDSKGECESNRYRSAQHDNIIFLRATNFFRHLLTIFLQAAALCARKQKVSFSSNFLCIFASA